jgi:hypothetical protein
VKRGHDATFTAAVRPLSTTDAVHPDLCELRSLIDAYPTRDLQDWRGAIAFLRELDALDSQFARGEMDAAAYAQTLEERHAAAPVESWMLATHLARLVARVMHCRHTRQTERTR